MGPSSYTTDVRSGLRPPQGSRQRAARHSLEHALTCWYRPLSQLLEILPRDFNSPGNDRIYVHRQLLPQEEIHRSSIRRPNRQYNQPSTYNPLSSTCLVQPLRTSSPQCTEDPSSRNHNLYLTAKNFSSSSPDRTVSRKSHYCWEVSVSGSRHGPTAMSQTIPYKTLTSKRIRHPCLRIPTHDSCERWTHSNAYNIFVRIHHDQHCIDVVAVYKFLP
jgi:hypothetical protein